MVVMIERPWRCDVTGNPVGTDTRMVGAPPCDCQGCRAEAAITGLSADRDSWRRVAERLEGEKQASEAEAASLRRKLEEAEQRADANADHARLANANFKDMDKARAANLERAEAAERRLKEHKEALTECQKLLSDLTGDKMVSVPTLFARAVELECRARTLTGASE